MTGNLYLRMIGNFELRRGPDVVALPPGGRRLVAFLALHAIPVPRALVLGTLWPDTTDEHGSANLRSALWRLGRTTDLVTARTGDLQLSPTVQVDLHELDALVADLRHGRARPATAQVRRLVDAGELLPGWDDGWITDRRLLFRHRRVDALEHLCVQLTAQDRRGLAAEAGCAAIAAEPLRESAHRALIHLHLAEGNRADALRQYRFYRWILARERGVEPSSAMRALGHDLEPGDG
jgi:DNA-binding SARP family transcriptional activator